MTPRFVAIDFADSTRRISRFYEYMFYLFVLLATLQNFLSIVAHRLIGDAAFPTLILKDIVVLIVIMHFGVRVVTGKRLDKELLLLIVTVAFIGAIFILGGADSLASFKLIINPIILIIVGLIIGPYIQVKKLVNFMLVIAAVHILLAWLEFFILADEVESFWEIFKLREYYNFRDPTITFLTGPYGNAPGRFYSYEFAFLGEGAVRRMASLTIVDPPIFAQFLAFVVVSAVWLKRGWLLIFSAPSLFLTLGKGGWLAAIIAFGILGCFLFRSKIERAFVGTVAAGLVLFVLSIGSGFESRSVESHLAGFWGGVASLSTNPLGLGVGEGGNRALRQADIAGASEFSERQFGAESTFGKFVVQLGVLGVVLYSYFVIVGIRALRAAVNRQEYVVGAVYFGTLGASLFSESALAYSGAGFLLILAAAVLRAGDRTNRWNRQMGASRNLTGAARSA